MGPAADESSVAVDAPTRGEERLRLGAVLRRGPGRLARPEQIKAEEAGHGFLPSLKRLLEPGRAWPSGERRQRLTPNRTMHPGDNPAPQGHDRRHAPTVALRGLAA